MTETPIKKQHLTLLKCGRVTPGLTYKKVDGIIRHGRFRSARASVFVSLSDKLATERMCSNNESFLPQEVKKERGPEEEVAECYKEPANQSAGADTVTCLVSEYQMKAFFL